MQPDTLIGLYTAHESKQDPPPEGSPEFTKYTACCIKKQCKEQTTDYSECGDPPNTWGMRLFDARVHSVAKLGDMTMLGACAAAFALAVIGIAFMVVRMRRSSRMPEPTES